MSLIPYYLFLLSIYAPMFFSSPPLGIWWKFSQPYSGEYNWLGPDLTLNTRGRYILIFPVVLITPTCRVVYPKATHLSWVGITLSTFCVDVNTICIWMYIQWQRTAYINKMQNSILNIPRFYSPDSHFSQVGHDTMGKISKQKPAMTDSFHIHGFTPVIVWNTDQTWYQVNCQ